jgi:hypothetical protein
MVAGRRREKLDRLDDLNVRETLNQRYSRL